MLGFLCHLGCMGTKAQYVGLRREVAEILAEADVMRITEGNPDPVGEYEGEAAEIVRRMLRAEQDGRTVDQGSVALALQEVFHREFEVSLDAERAAELAAKILRVAAG